MTLFIMTIREGMVAFMFWYMVGKVYLYLFCTMLNDMPLLYIHSLESDASRIRLRIFSNQDALRMTVQNQDDYIVNGRVTYQRRQFIGLITHAQPQSANNVSKAQCNNGEM